MIHLINKAEQRFLRFGKERRLHISQDTIDQFLATKQFRRDRGVRLRSKWALVQA